MLNENNILTREFDKDEVKNVITHCSIENFLFCMFEMLTILNKSMQGPQTCLIKNTVHSLVVF